MEKRQKGSKYQKEVDKKNFFEEQFNSLKEEKNDTKRMKRNWKYFFGREKFIQKNENIYSLWVIFFSKL